MSFFPVLVVVSILTTTLFQSIPRSTWRCLELCDPRAPLQPFLHLDHPLDACNRHGDSTNSHDLQCVCCLHRCFLPIGVNDIVRRPCRSLIVLCVSSPAAVWYRAIFATPSSRITSLSSDFDRSFKARHSRPAIPPTASRPAVPSRYLVR